jgi:hypothetical protein
MSEPSIIDRLASAITELHTELAADPEAAFAALAQCMITALPEAEHVGISRIDGAGCELLAATSAVVERFAALQTEAAGGPSVDAASRRAVCGCDDVEADERWPGLGPRAVDETGVRSALAFPVPSICDGDPPLIVTVLAGRPAAFSDQDALAALALAACGVLAGVSARHAARIRNLERALETNRDIGTAIGVLMALHRTTREHAFELLRSASQASHRKVSELARSVVDTGSLDGG